MTKNIDEVFRMELLGDKRFLLTDLNEVQPAFTEKQWLSILNGDKIWSRYLRAFAEGFANKYEQFAFEHPANFEEFEHNIFTVLLKVKPASREILAWNFMRRLSQLSRL